MGIESILLGDHVQRRIPPDQHPGNTGAEMSTGTLDKLESLYAAANKERWCAIIPPDNCDPEEYPYGWGEIRTEPTDDPQTNLGWNLIVKVDEHDEQDANLELIAEMHNAMPEILQALRAQRRTPHEQDKA
jgi:hypothetical protein